VPDADLLPVDPHRLPPPSAWFAPDAERHLLDRPRHCPQCGASLVDGRSITTEYWMADDRVFFTWCGSCHWTGTIVPVERVTTTEPEH